MCKLIRYEFCTETADFRNTRSNREQTIIRCEEWDEILSDFKTQKGEEYVRARQRLRNHLEGMYGATLASLLNSFSSEEPPKRILA